MSTLILINDSCDNQKVDVIVNAANRYLAAGGGVCGAIFSKAGMTELTNSQYHGNTIGEEHSHFKEEPAAA